MQRPRGLPEGAYTEATETKAPAATLPQCWVNRARARGISGLHLSIQPAAAAIRSASTRVSPCFLCLSPRLTCMSQNAFALASMLLSQATGRFMFLHPARCTALFSTFQSHLQHSLIPAPCLLSSFLSSLAPFFFLCNHVKL